MSEDLYRIKHKKLYINRHKNSNIRLKYIFELILLLETIGLDHSAKLRTVNWKKVDNLLERH